MKDSDFQIAVRKWHQRGYIIRASASSWRVLVKVNYGETGSPFYYNTVVVGERRSANKSIAPLHRMKRHRDAAIACASKHFVSHRVDKS